MIFGKDKCGKTSLLKHIQLHHLKNYSYSGIIPFFIDYKEYEHRDSPKINFKKEIANYYQLNSTDTNELLNGTNLLLLIDNLNTNSIVHEPLIEFIQQKEKIYFIICSDYIASRIFIEEIDHLNYNKIYFKNLTIKEIRLYTKKHPEIREETENMVIEKITGLCTQLQLPLNYWTVSLILLIYKKSNDDYTKNLFSVLDACVDEMLNKKRFIFEKTSLKFEQYKALCSQIAYYLLIAHKDTEYCADYGKLIMFIDDCIKKNKRIVSNAKDIFDYLFNVGILKRKGNNYTFRLNGIFEYFLAFYTRDHPAFKDKILNEDSIYLSFKNELELYSGFIRNDLEFLIKIFKKTKTKFDPIIQDFNNEGSIDQNLIRKISDANDFGKNIKSLLVKNPLQNEIQDQIFDNSDPLATNAEVHLKESIDTSYINFELLEKYISILSKVFKNLDSIEDSAIIEEIFDYIIDCYCNLGFHFIKEYEELAKQENILSLDETQAEYVIGEEILKMMSKIIPVLMESMLFDGVGHINLKRVVVEKIEKLKIDFRKNQYKLFLLYFLYIDLDIDTHKDKIDEVFELITLAPLKVATLFKLNFYLAFKAYKNLRLEAFLKNKIQKAQLRIDNKSDINEMQKGLSNKKKRNMVRKQQWK